MFSNHLIKDLPNFLNFTFLKTQHNSSNYDNVFNFGKKSYLINDGRLTSQQIEIASGIIIVFLIAIGFENFKEFVKIKSIEVQKTFLSFKSKFKSVCFNVIILLLIPIVGIVCFLFFCYRQIVNIILHLKYGDKFKGLLQGTDPIWAVENSGSYNIINILLFLEVNIKDVPKLVQSFQNVFTEKILTNPKTYWKLFHTRKIEYGYIFWYKPDSFDISDHVRELKRFDDNSTISELNLATVVEKYCNTKLPNKHESSWEILVGQQHISCDNILTEDDSLVRIPVLFRIHHSIGDGVSLLKMLLDLISDTKDSDFLNGFFANRSSEKLIKQYEEIENCMKTGLGRYSIYYGYLVESVYQLLFSKDDENILHGPNLSGEKVIAWTCDQENDSLMTKIRNIRKMYTNVTFSDVLLTGVSMGFYEYFKNKSTTVPKKITVVVPVRVSKSMFTITKSVTKNDLIKENEEFELANNFSVGMISLPLCDRNNFHANIRCVHRLNTKFKQQSDYVFNFVVMKLLSATLPLELINSTLKSTKSTLVMSNLPGPKNLTICKKYRLRNIIFWVPHRDTTGIGFSLLSYDGQLQMGINADKALIPTTEDARQLLKNIVDSLKCLNIT